MRTRKSLQFLFIVVVAIVGGADVAQSEEQERSSFNPCGRGTAGQRFVLFDSGTTVCDNTSGVRWERTPLFVQRTFLGAQAYCAAKGPGWQLPDIKDFFALVDYGNLYPSLPLPAGHPFTVVSRDNPTGVTGSEYWTRTPKLDGNPGEVWSFVMDLGRTFGASIDGTSDFVWCVK